MAARGALMALLALLLLLVVARGLRAEPPPPPPHQPPHQPQEQQPGAGSSTPVHSGPSLAQGGCNVNGKMYSVAERWERVYLGRMLTCTCFGGDRGWTCEGKPEPESCFDQYTGGRYRAGETWERPKGGLVWDCTCLGASVSRISCTTASRCHEGGSSYKIGDKWRRVHESGGYMMDCVCLGNGKGEWICNPVSGSQERCYDNTLGSAHLVGDTWERPYQGWMVVDCTCLGEGQGRIACTSRNRCNDQETRRSYKVGETWSRTDARGQPLRCLCIGNGNGEWKCDRQTSSVTATGVQDSATHQSSVQQTSVHTSVHSSMYRPTVQCESDGGVLFSTGERWVKSQEGGQLLCTCQPSGVNCQTITIKTHGGNSDGAPCVFPFTHEGRVHSTCTAEGRDDGKLWCSTTADYAHDKKFSLCSQEEGTTVTLVTTRGGNSNGALCHFPFVFGGREHVACTSEGRADGMKWCSTTANFDTDQRYGFCPMAAHEDVCTADGVQHRVGDQWDRPHELGHAMRCTCIGGGRGDWTCVPYTKILDQCVIDGRTYNVNQTFLKRHDEGHMMNCTCLGQGRGRWKCDAMDQCQDTDSRQFYQIGETWVRLVEGSPYMCICLGKGIGEWSCNPQTNLNEVKTPIQVFISDASNQATSSHPRIEWANTQLPHVMGYLLRWRQKNSRLSWREVSVPARLNSYTITGLKPGLTYEGQLITLLVSGLREVTRFEFTTSLVTHHFTRGNEGETRQSSFVGGTVPPVLSGASETMTEITSSSFLVSWVSTSSSVSGFRVEYELSEDGAVTHRLDLPNTANSVSLENLLPGRRYHVKVYEVTEGQDDSLILITTQTTAPDAPQQYEVTEATDTSLVIRWIAPKAPIRGYRIVFTPVEEGSRPELASTELTLPSESTSVTLSGLAPGITYNITLTAVGETQDSEPIFIQQSTLPGTGQHRELILASPTDLQFVAVTETKIVLMWNRPVAPDDAVMGFRIVVTPLGRAQEPFRVPFTEHTFADMDGLQPGITYRFEVFAVYHQDGQESQPLVGEQTTLVDAPSDMRFVEITEMSVTINWTAPQAALDSYHLSYGPTRAGAGRPKSLALSPEARHHTERGLRPATEYTITLRSVKNGQRSVPLSAIFTTRPLPGSLPEIITEITETSLTFRWKPTASVSVLASVQLPEHEAPFRTETSESGSILIDGLTPGEQYIVTVSILWDGRQIARPATKTITTQVGPPRNVQVDVNPDNGELTITWQRMTVPGVTGYRVRGTPLHGQRGHSVDELVRPDQTSVTVEGLTPGVEYNITVTAVKNGQEGKPSSTIVSTDIPQPSDLSFTNVSDTSLVLRWTPLSLPGITGYRVTVSLPGDSSPLLEDVVGPRTAIYAIEGLQPGVVYDISVSTLVEDGESEPARRSQTTTVPPPTDLRFTQVELDSFRVSWSAPPISTTESFLIRYSPLRHEDLLSEVSTSPDEFEVILTGLLPGTVYGVSVHTVIRGHESVGLSGTQGTEIDAPTDMEFLDVTDSTFTVYWTPSNAPVSGYRVAYGPQLLGHVAEDSVPPERTSIVLASLQAGTEYTVSVYAIGRDVHRESGPLVGSQATNSNGPTDLVITRTSPTTFSVSWTPPPISVRYYRLSYVETGSRRPPAELTIPGTRNSAVILGLQPGTEYTVSLYAVTGRGDSPATSKPITKTESTQVDTPSGLEVMEVTDRTIRIRWAPSKAPINGYRVTSIPKTGRGTQDTRELPSGRTDVTIDGLLPTLEYAVNVYALSDHGESLPASKNVVTGIDAPKGLTFTDVDVDSMSISWDSPEGTVTGYRVLYESLEDSVPQTLSPAPDGDADTAVISQLQPGSDYKVSVTALHHGTESLPLVGTQATAIPPPTALKLVQATSTSLSIQWQPPSAEVSGFRVVVTPREKSGPSRDHMVPADVNSFTLPSLMVATQYNVFVYALKNGHTSKPLQDVFTTLENISPPRKPRVVNVTETSITVNWRAKSDTLSGFLISVVPSSTAPSVEKTLSPDARQFTIADLLPGIHYTISIYAVSGNTRSQPATVTATTALDAPKDLRFDSASQDSITFSWQPPRAPIMSYVVTYSSEVGSLNRLTPAPGPRDTSATITNLLPSTRYTIGIYAVQNSMRSAQLTGKHRTEQELQLPQLATRPPNFPARYIPPFLDIPTSSQHSSTVLERDPSSESRNPTYHTRQRPLNNRQSGRPLSGQRTVGDFLAALTPRFVDTTDEHKPANAQYKPANSQTTRRIIPGRFVRPDELAESAVTPSILGPQEAAKTLTTISWSPQPQASEYLLSCYPLSGEGETTQIRVPAGTSSATLAGLADGTQYSIVVEALQGTQRYRVHEEVVTARAVSSTPHDGVGTSDEDLCLDTATSIYYSVGQEWERLSENGFMLYCRCLGFGNGHYRCDSSRWCHDSGKNYREGETWDRPADNGQMLTCTCLGRGKGEYKCEPHEASCYDEGKMYQAGDQWRKLYRGAMCTCTCLGGQQGWRCEECRSPSEEDAGSSHTAAAASHSSSASQGVFSQYIQSVRRSAGTNCAFNCR
ncbi:unnamed protein product [Lampetra planeri]